jgi:hypothetical protein
MTESLLAPPPPLSLEGAGGANVAAASVALVVKVCPAAVVVAPVTAREVVVAGVADLVVVEASPCVAAVAPASQLAL